VLSGDSRNNVGRRHLIQQAGQSGRKLSTFIHYLRTEAQEHSRDDQQQDQIDLETGQRSDIRERASTDA